MKFSWPFNRKKKVVKEEPKKKIVPMPSLEKKEELIKFFKLMTLEDGGSENYRYGELRGYRTARNSCDSSDGMYDTCLVIYMQYSGIVFEGGVPRRETREHMETYSSLRREIFIPVKIADDMEQYVNAMEEMQKDYTKCVWCLPNGNCGRPSYRSSWQNRLMNYPSEGKEECGLKRLKDIPTRTQPICKCFSNAYENLTEKEKKLCTCESSSSPVDSTIKDPRICLYCNGWFRNPDEMEEDDK